jgi:hypothetical protein
MAEGVNVTFAVTTHRATCPAVVLLDFDSIHCRLPAEHDGDHLEQGDGPAFTWRLA